MRTSESWDGLIAQVYESAVDVDQWPGVIGHAGKLLGARSAQCFVADWSTGQITVSDLICHQINPEASRQWLADYLDKDLWTMALAPRIGDNVATGAAAVERGHMRRSVIYSDLLRPNQIEDLLCTLLVNDGSVHMVLSYLSPELFQRRQVDLLRRLRPHLRNAVRLQRQLASVRARAGAAEAALDALAIGVLILDAAGRVVHANRKAEAILNSRDGVGLSGRRLRCERWTDTAALELAIGKAAGVSTHRPNPSGDPVAVSRPSLRRPFSLLVAPLSRRFWDGSPPGADARRRGVVLITITDPDERLQLPVDCLVRLFGLTPAEARLAAALAADQSLDDYAQRAGITKGTARWTLKCVLEKTGCRRQSELVRLLVTSVAGLVWTE